RDVSQSAAERLNTYDSVRESVSRLGRTYVIRLLTLLRLLCNTTPDPLTSPRPARPAPAKLSWTRFLKRTAAPAGPPFQRSFGGGAPCRHCRWNARPKASPASWLSWRWRRCQPGALSSASRRRRAFAAELTRSVASQ